MTLPPRPTDWLQESRLVVVSVDPVSRHLRLRGPQDACSDMSCGRDTVVVADEGITSALDAGRWAKAVPGTDFEDLVRSFGASPRA